MKIRSSVNALIIKDRKVLTIKKRNGENIDYILPGGGQEFGETLEMAVKREVKEEVGATIKNMELIFVREYIGMNHQYSERDKEIHVVSHIFKCEIDEDSKFVLEPDEDQVGLEWIEISKLNKYNFYPKGIIERLEIVDDVFREFYLGDIN